MLLTKLNYALNSRFLAFIKTLKLVVFFFFAVIFEWRIKLYIKHSDSRAPLLPNILVFQLCTFVSLIIAAHFSGVPKRSTTAQIAALRLHPTAPTQLLQFFWQNWGSPGTAAVHRRRR